MPSALFYVHFGIHAMVWPGMVLFRAIRFGAARFCPSYTNLRQPHIFKHQI